MFLLDATRGWARSRAATPRPRPRVLQDLAVDAGFLDIQMPGLTGLDLAQVLRRFRRRRRSCSVTAHEEHAVEAFDLHAVDYVLKPVREERLAEAVRRVIAARPPGAQRRHPDPGRARRRHPLHRPQRRHPRRGQGDYARPHTIHASHLVRRRCRPWPRMGDAGFVRIHRSLLSRWPTSPSCASTPAGPAWWSVAGELAGQQAPYPRAARAPDPTSAVNDTGGSGSPAAPTSGHPDPPIGTREIDAGTDLGRVYMQSLLREQLRLALRILALLGVTVGMLPLAFHLIPGARRRCGSGRCRCRGCCSASSSTPG